MSSPKTGTGSSVLTTNLAPKKLGAINGDTFLEVSVLKKSPSKTPSTKKSNNSNNKSDKWTKQLTSPPLQKPTVKEPTLNSSKITNTRSRRVRTCGPLNEDCQRGGKSQNGLLQWIPLTQWPTCTRRKNELITFHHFNLSTEVIKIILLTSHAY